MWEWVQRVYHVFGWGFLLVFTELHSPAVPQDCYY